MDSLRTKICVRRASNILDIPLQGFFAQLASHLCSMGVCPEDVAELIRGLVSKNEDKNTSQKSNEPQVNSAIPQAPQGASDINWALFDKIISHLISQHIELTSELLSCLLQGLIAGEILDIDSAIAYLEKNGFTPSEPSTPRPR